MAVDPESDTIATPEPPVARGNPDLPDLRNWGGLRRTKKEVRRSATIMANREAIAYELLAMASTKITDVMEWDEDGNVKLKSSSKISEQHARMIKSVEQRFDKDGNVLAMKVTLFDKVGTLRLLAQAAGLLKSDSDEDRPSVIGVTVRGPKKRKPVTIDNEGGKS